MTLSEALKTGEKIRRKYTTEWMSPKELLRLYDIDILANDWEVYREPRTFDLYVCPVTNELSLKPDEFYRFEKIKVKEVL